MRINRWKVATISLVGILLWLAYSVRPVAAQYGETYHITKATSSDVSLGSIRVSGEVKGFTCIADVRGDLMKGDGAVNSTVNCYVLSK